jgi:hypothetical protein
VTEARTDWELTFFRGEVGGVYCADFSGFPEVAAGDTLSNPTVVLSSGPSLMTIGTPEINAADFQELSVDGNVEKTVPAGKGSKVKLTPPAVGGVKGECFLTFLVKPSSGDADARIGLRLKCTVK